MLSNSAEGATRGISATSASRRPTRMQMACEAVYQDDDEDECCEAE